MKRNKLAIRKFDDISEKNDPCQGPRSPISTQCPCQGPFFHRFMCRALWTCPCQGPSFYRSMCRALGTCPCLGPFFYRSMCRALWTCPCQGPFFYRSMCRALLTCPCQGPFFCRSMCRALLTCPPPPSWSVQGWPFPALSLSHRLSCILRWAIFLYAIIIWFKYTVCFL